MWNVPKWIVHAKTPISVCRLQWYPRSPKSGDLGHPLFLLKIQRANATASADPSTDHPGDEDLSSGTPTALMRGTNFAQEASLGEGEIVVSQDSQTVPGAPGVGGREPEL